MVRGFLNEFVDTAQMGSGVLAQQACGALGAPPRIDASIATRTSSEATKAAGAGISRIFYAYVR